MSYKTDYARAKGWGSAHEGVHHFVIQRITAIALVPLALLFIFPFARALGGGYDTAVQVYSNGWNALVAVNFLIIGFWHLKLGLQVIIEDYAHGKRARFTLLFLNIAFCWTFAAAGVFAVLKVALGS